MSMTIKSEAVSKIAVKLPIWQMKAELKKLADEIREDRAVRRKKDNTASEKNTAECCARSTAREYRHWHIAYCLLRGKTYKQIENKVAKGNEPQMSYVEMIKERYELPKPKEKPKDEPSQD
jgi:hypothetical protein